MSGKRAESSFSLEHNRARQLVRHDRVWKGKAREDDQAWKHGPDVACQWRASTHRLRCGKRRIGVRKYNSNDAS